MGKNEFRIYYLILFKLSVGWQLSINWQLSRSKKKYLDPNLKKTLMSLTIDNTYLKIFILYYFPTI